jgi:hypothetical protein
MSSLSQFAPFASGGLKSYQTGYVSAEPSAGSGEDTKFFDVTVSSVSTSKTMCSFAGSGSTISSGRAMAYYSQNGAEIQAILSARMTSSTNLRLATSYSSPAPTFMVGRWQIAEAN